MAEKKPPTQPLLPESGPVLELKAAVGSMVASILAARVAMDLETAELARQYQEHELLRQFTPPAFGISEVTIRLPFAAVGVEPGRLPDPRKMVLDEIPDMLVQVGAELLSRLPQHAIGQVELKLIQDQVSVMVNPRIID